MTVIQNNINPPSTTTADGKTTPPINTPSGEIVFQSSDLLTLLNEIGNTLKDRAVWVKKVTSVVIVWTR